MVGSNW
ncbi:hypothetical protein RDI58_009474 [Solanum bulbocastanum]